MRIAACGLLLALLAPVGGCSGSIGPLSRIVLVSLDTTRADHLGCYGHAGAITPHLDRLAEEGVLFEQAVSSIATTLPSHATMFTGLYPFAHGVRYNIVFRLGQEAFTLAEALQQAGFATLAVPASYVVARQFGLDQGFDQFHEPPTWEGGSPHSLRSASDGVDLTLAWLAEQRGRKTFTWLHFYEAHHPYTPPFPYSSQFRDRRYDGEIAYMDEQFGRLIEALRADEEWSETLVVVAGDHGEGLHEHREKYHTNLVYEGTQRVPFIMHAPGLRSARVKAPVGLVDLMPTVLDLAGVKTPPALQGRSLAPYLTGGRLPSRDLYFEAMAGALNYGWAELRGVRRDNWKIIDSPEPELYDLDSDPGELNNLAAVEPERLEDLRRGLTDLTSDDAAGERPMAEKVQDEILDSATEQFLASLGYVGGGSGGPVAEGAPQPASMIDMEGDLMAGQMAISQRNWPIVEATCRYVLGRDPTNKWALNCLTTALLSLDRADEAKEFAAEQVRLYPQSPRAYVSLARAHRSAGDPDGAVAVLERGMQAVEGSEWLSYMILVARFDAGDPEICERVRSTMQAFSESSRIMILEARCLARAGETAGALEWLEKAAAQGFDRFEQLREAEDFDAVGKLPGFEALLDSNRADEAESAGDSAGSTG